MTDGPLELTLPLAPSMNRYWRAYAGRVILSKDGRRYRDDAVADVWQAIGKPKTMRGRIELHIVVHPRDRRSIDIDNRIKPTMDMLAHAGVYENDSQVDKLTVVRGAIIKGGLMQVWVSELKSIAAHG